MAAPTPETSTEPALQVIAMHGWAGTAASWDPWLPAARARGWHWSSGERGYGAAPPFMPSWQPQGLRVLIAHSLGVHLLPPELLPAAERVVLLAGFGCFVPPGRPGRSLRTALVAMDAALADIPDDPTASALRAQALLRDFLVQAASPDPVSLMPSGPADQPLPAPARQLLRRDLALLAASTDLPAGFPEAVPVLLVEAGDDRIVAPAARDLLAERLPGAERIILAGAGHAFLSTSPQAAVLEWLERTLAP
jgi:pimeloyl-[acyl-carrier protein] methyl ester esterase